MVRVNYIIWELKVLNIFILWYYSYNFFCNFSKMFLNNFMTVGIVKIVNIMLFKSKVGIEK